MSEVNTFHSCCAALQTGNGFAEAQSWLNSLMEDEVRCFELCVIVISSKESPANAIFLAAKISYNSFKQNKHWGAVNEQTQCEILKIYVNALFFNDAIVRGPDDVNVAAKRQLCLCLSAILLCPASATSCVDLLMGGLQQFASTCEDSAMCVLCIIEELPTEWKRHGVSSSAAAAAAIGSGGTVVGPGSINMAKFLPLRVIVTDVLRSAAQDYYTCVGRWSTRGSKPYALDAARADAKKIQLTISALKCLQAWTVAHVTSEDEDDDIDDIYPSGGIMPLKSLITTNLATATSSSPSSSSAAGISVSTGFMDQATGAEEYCAAAENDVERSTFQTLLYLLAVSVRVMSDCESSAKNASRSGSASSSSNGSFGSSGSSGGGASLDRSPQAVTEIVTMILNIFVELSSFPSLSDSKVGHFEGARQVQALRICIGLYHSFFVIAEVWNILLGGLIPWRQTLEAKWADSTSNLAETHGGTHGGGMAGASSSLQQQNDAPMISEIHNMRDLLAESNEALRGYPASLLTALVDLTSAFVEKHSWLLFGSSWLYTEARAQSSATVAQYFNFTHSPLAAGSSPNDPSIIGYLLTSSLLAALATPHKSAAVGVAEVVVYLSKTLPKIVSEHLLRPAVEPVLAVLFAQILYPISSCKEQQQQQQQLQGLQQPQSQKDDADAVMLREQAQLQRAFVDYERANREGRTAPTLPGDIEEELVSVIEFRQESALLFQTISNSWPSGAIVWERVCRLLFSELNALQQMLQHLQDPSSQGALQQQQQSGCGGGGTDIFSLLQALYDRARIAEGLLFIISCLVENINDPARRTPTVSPSSSPIVGPRFSNHSTTMTSSSSTESGGGVGGGGGGDAATAMSVVGAGAGNLSNNGGRKSSFRTAKDCLASKNSDGSSVHQARTTWFDDLAMITGLIAQVQSQLHNLQGTWPGDRRFVPSFPAIELRFLELWDAAAVAARHLIGTGTKSSGSGGPSKKQLGSQPSAAAAAAADVVTCAVHVICRSIETHPSLVSRGFHTLCTITSHLKEHLTHAIALSEWLLGLAARQEVLELMKRDVTLTGKVFATLGRSIGIIADLQAKENCTSIVLSLLTSALEAGRLGLSEAAAEVSLRGSSGVRGTTRRNSGRSLTTGRIGGYDVLKVDLGRILPQEVLTNLQQCHHNLFGLKGLLRGLCDHGHEDGAGEDELEEVAYGDNSATGCDDGSDQQKYGRTSGDADAMGCTDTFCKFVPQLCAGIFNVLETLITFESVLIAEYGPRYQMEACMSSSGMNLVFDPSFRLSYKLLDGDNTSQLLLRITEQVCNTLFRLVDSSPPYACPYASLAECSQRTVSLLTDCPLVSSVPHFIALATALIRRAAEFEDLLPALCRMQILCFVRAVSILGEPTSLLFQSQSDGDPFIEGWNPDSTFELLTEVLRGFRQSCISCPQLLVAQFSDLPGAEAPSSIDMFFECFLKLIKSNSLSSNSGILRAMQTSLSALRTTNPPLFNTPAFQQSVHARFPGTISAVLGLALFGDDDRIVRPYSGFLENLLLFYREALGEVQVTALLEHVCSQLSAELMQYTGVIGTGSGSGSGSGSFDPRQGVTVSLQSVFGGSGSSGNGQMPSLSLCRPSRDGPLMPPAVPMHTLPQPPDRVVLSTPEFLQVVYETLAHHATTLNLPECLLRQSFTELCHLAKSPSSASAAGGGGSTSPRGLMSAGIEGPIIGRKRSASLFLKLIVWPAALRARFIAVN